MKLIIFLALLTTVVLAESTNSTQILETIVLTEETFLPFVQSHENVVTLWHGADRKSQKFIPEYVQLSEYLKSNGFENIEVVQVSTQKNIKIATAQGVTFVPQIEVYYQNGLQRQSYKGNLFLKDIGQWLIKLLKNPRQPSKLIANSQQLEEKQSRFILFSLFVGHSQDTEEFKAYFKIAGKRKDIIFFHSFSEEVRDSLLLQPEEQSIFLFSRREQKEGMKYINKYQGNLLNSDAIKLFFRVHDTPNMKILKASQSGEIQKGTLPNIVLAMDLADYGENRENMDENMSQLEKDFLNLRPKFLNKATLMFLNMTQAVYEDLNQQFQLENKQPPYLLITDIGEKVNKYAFKGENITSESIVNFYSDFKNGKLNVISQSENKTDPELQNTLLVKSVTLHDWEELVLESPVDVIVFFYSLGCHQSKEMKPKFYRLAYRMKNNPNIKFVRVNINLNDLPDVVVKKTPEIWLYKADENRSTLSFIFESNPENIIKNIENQLTFPWVEPIPSSEVNPSDILIDKTPNEKLYERELKKEMKKQELEQKKEEEERRRALEEEEKKKLEVENPPVENSEEAVEEENNSGNANVVEEIQKVEEQIQEEGKERTDL